MKLYKRKFGDALKRIGITFSSSSFPKENLGIPQLRNSFYNRILLVKKESHLAIETSGHGALKENHWLDDGAYLMVKVLNKLASARASGSVGGSKVVTDLVGSLEEPGISIELRFKIDQSCRSQRSTRNGYNG